METYAQWEAHLLKLAGEVQAAAFSEQAPAFLPESALRQAYRQCGRITAEHSKSFYMASALLPADKRVAVRALYAFCRTVDDLVDESTVEDRDERLDYWRRLSTGHTKPGPGPVSQAWADTLRRFRIPPLYALQLIDGVSSDLHRKRYETFDELAAYCYRVASTVGLMSMHITGFCCPEAVPYAIRLGVALQLTNILRDIAEDHRAGRIYLPQDELRQYGLSDADIAEGRVTPAWRDFMRFQIERARGLYRASWPGIKLLDHTGRLSIGAALTFYSGILDDIERHDYDVFSRRAHLTAWEKIRRIPALWLKIVRL